MAKKFSELRDKMPVARQERARLRTQQMLAGVRLRRLREERQITQQELAKELHRTQAAISQMEQRADLLLSTLIEYIEATGGELVMTARYPEGDIPISPVITGREDTQALAKRWRGR